MWDCKGSLRVLLQIRVRGTATLGFQRADVVLLGMLANRIPWETVLKDKEVKECLMPFQKKILKMQKQCLNHHPWGCFRDIQMWHLATWLGCTWDVGHGGFVSAGLTVGFHNLRGVFQHQ